MADEAPKVDDDVMDSLVRSTATPGKPRSSSSQTKTKPKSSSSSKKKTPSSQTKNETPSSKQTPSSSKSTATTPKTTPRSKHSKTTMDMAHEAIVALKDRSGSSQVAIIKYMLEKYDHLQDNKSFRTRLNAALKNAVQQKRFLKNKASYKISAEWKKKQDRKRKAANEKRRKQEQAKKKASGQVPDEATREKQQRQQEKAMESMNEEELQKFKLKLQKQEEARKKKEALLKYQKERSEVLRKRRFPMEDTKLHQQDAQWNVKPPPDVARRPNLPYFFSVVSEKNKKKGGKTPASILVPSKVEFLQEGNRGLVPDLLQVYHFFRGDVNYQLPTEGESLVPEFSLLQLVYATQEVVNGNAKKSKLVPPLVSHLFVSCLRLLTSVQSHETEHHPQLGLDLQKLAAGLSPASWGEVCFLYMDCMERYYATTASVNPTVLKPCAIDVQYLMRASDNHAPATPGKAKPLQQQQEAAAVLPEGYGAYLGEPQSALHKAFWKLSKHDPWMLTAEELMAVLRALTDDILALKPEIGADISRRDEEMSELLKAKRAADSHFRKIRLAYEGPKQPSKSAKAVEGKTEDTNAEKKSTEEPTPRKQLSSSDEGDGKNGNAKDEKKPAAFKPTATKKQFETATKAQQKAHDAYEKGLRNLLARTEPAGYDRNHNAVYYFNHDPDMLYVEMIKAPAAPSDSLPEDMQMKRMSWHVIETKSLFDDFVASLDIRGRRENALYDTLLGPEGGHYSLRRGLYDDIKEQTAKAGRKKERENLERRLENARIAVDAEEIAGRRSGRLQSRAQIDLAQVEQEIEDIERQIEADAVPFVPDYEELTGLNLMKKFDATGRRTRRSRELKALSVTRNLPDMPCTKLCATGNIDGSGTVGMVVSEILELEARCEALVPWERDDISRGRWITDLEELVHAWNDCSPLQVGPVSHIMDDSSEIGSPSVQTPSGKSRRISPDSETSSKRQRLESGSPASTSSLASASPAQILTLLRVPLVDLEQRVFEITGLQMATQDADEADDNMSTTSDDAEELRSAQELKEKLAWKKKVNALRSIPTKRHSQIREVVVEAISLARKAQLGSVVAELRSALLLHHPNAASECRNAALAVLESHGGYEEDSDSDEESEAGEEFDTEEEGQIQSLLSGDAMMVTGNLKGDNNANRVDWIDAVKSCKTISRWATLATGFTRNGFKMLEKIEAERDTLYDALDAWKKEEDRRARSRAGKTKATQKKDTVEENKEVWANCIYSNDFCMAKLEGFPFWPAKKVEAKDQDLKRSLQDAGRVLVALVGEEGGLRAVRMEDVRPFDGKLDGEDLSTHSKTVRTQLDECMTMARRILRGRGGRKARGGVHYVEEKKTAA